MKNIKQKLRAGLLLVSAPLLFACSAESNKVQQVQTDKQHEQLGRSVGKPSAPISIDYKILTQSPTPGQTIEVEVNFKSSVKAPINASLSPNKSISVLNAQRQWTNKIEKSGQHEVSPLLKIVAPNEGRFYISFVASIEVDGKVLKKPFSIPVEIGEGPFDLQQTGEVITDSNGNKVKVHKVN